MILFHLNINQSYMSFKREREITLRFYMLRYTELTTLIYIFLAFIDTRESVNLLAYFLCTIT